MSDPYILDIKQLKKTYITKKSRTKKVVEAVKGVDLQVSKGDIFGFLGPNGAGKTTTLNMLTTLLAPTSGTAVVVGYDLLSQPQEIRKHIGYVSQAGGADTSMNAIENLILQARLYGISYSDAKKRTDQLVEQFQITEFASRIVSSYSGGQKRRLDLALGIVHHPEIVFLDEPTTGLDPQSRAHFWDEIRSVNQDGTTVFVTTHYLDEADNLCNHIAIVDHGIIVASGTPEELKKSIGAECITIGYENEIEVEKAKKLIEKEERVQKVYRENDKLTMLVSDGEHLLVELIRLFDVNQLHMQTIELTKPSLDDVFLQKTGRSLREGGES